jgi:hypothetical protein
MSFAEVTRLVAAVVNASDSCWLMLAPVFGTQK